MMSAHLRAIPTRAMSPLTRTAWISQHAIGSYQLRPRTAPLSQNRSIRRTLLNFWIGNGRWAANRPVGTLCTPHIPTIKNARLVNRLSHALGSSCAKASYTLL